MSDSEQGGSVFGGTNVRDARRAPTIDRQEANRLMEQARRLFAVAEVVQERRFMGGVDSVVLLHRSLTLLMKLLLRLHGDSVPTTFAELVDRAQVISRQEALFAEDPGPDLALIEETRTRFVHDAADVPPADDRRYDRAFARSVEWLNVVQTCLDDRLPQSKVAGVRYLTLVLAAACTFAVGMIAGRHTAPAPSVQGATSVHGSDPRNALRPSPPLALPAKLKLTDEHIACDGCFPIEGFADRPYAWTTGKAAFAVQGLVPQRRYRITIEILDTGRVARATVGGWRGGLSQEVAISKGAVTIPWPMMADAVGIVQWSMKMDPWKPKDHVDGSNDARELGVNIGEVGIDELPKNTGPDAG